MLRELVNTQATNHLVLELDICSSSARLSVLAQIAVLKRCRKEGQTRARADYDQLSAASDNLLAHASHNVTVYQRRPSVLKITFCFVAPPSTGGSTGVSSTQDRAPEHDAPCQALDHRGRARVDVKTSK